MSPSTCCTIYPDRIVVIVTNSADYASAEMAVEPESQVAVGQGVLKVTK